MGRGRWLSSVDGHQLLQGREHHDAEASETHMGTWGHWAPEYDVKVAHCLGICILEERIFVTLGSLVGHKPLSFCEIHANLVLDRDLKKKKKVKDQHIF